MELCKNCSGLMYRLSYIDKSIFNSFRFIEYCDFCIELMIMAMGKGLLVLNRII